MILLAACNAKFIHSNPAVYDLQAVGQRSGEEIRVAEYTINQPRAEVLKSIYQLAPDVLCFSCYIWNISYIRALAEDLHRLLPDLPIWAGGPEVSFDAPAFLRENRAFCGVMIHEGEETFLELCTRKAFSPSARYRDIAGVCVRCGEEIVTGQARPCLSMDEIPFIYRDFSLFENRILYYESSRGCPFSCSYCLSSIDKQLRFRSLAKVLPELEIFLQQRVPQVKFVDRTFNCRHEHALAIWRYILAHDNGVTNFHFEISADLLNEEELSLLERMRPGLVQLEIGVQSTCERTLKEIRRSCDLKALKKNVARIRKARNIHQHLDLIAGLPYEDLARFRISFNEVYAMEPDQLQLGFLKVLKGSYMSEKAGDYGIVTGKEPPYEVLSTAWMSFDDILELKMVERMVEVYYNSGQFQHSLDLLLDLFPDAYSFYRELGLFYERRGYETISHSRLRRYEILLEFFRETFADRNPGALCEAMGIDLYLRERMKSRPSFLPDQKACEEQIWKIRREKKISRSAHLELLRDGRALLFDYEHRDPLSGNAFLLDLGLKADG